MSQNDAPQEQDEDDAQEIESSSEALVEADLEDVSGGDYADWQRNATKRLLSDI